MSKIAEFEMATISGDYSEMSRTGLAELPCLEQDT